MSDRHSRKALRSADHMADSFHEDDLEVPKGRPRMSNPIEQLAALLDERAEELPADDPRARSGPAWVVRFRDLLWLAERVSVARVSEAPGEALLDLLESAAKALRDVSTFTKGGGPLFRELLADCDRIAKKCEMAVWSVTTARREGDLEVGAGPRAPAEAPGEPPTKITREEVIGAFREGVRAHFGAVPAGDGAPGPTPIEGYPERPILEQAMEWLVRGQFMLTAQARIVRADRTWDGARFTGDVHGVKPDDWKVAHENLDRTYDALRRVHRMLAEIPRGEFIFKRAAPSLSERIEAHLLAHVLVNGATEGSDYYWFGRCRCGWNLKRAASPEEVFEAWATHAGAALRRLLGEP